MHYRVLFIVLQIIKKSLDERLLEPGMQQVYQDACLKGTKRVFQTRLMLVGYFSAGKSSVKRNLLNEKFLENHDSTVGIDTEDQTCVVDVETAVDWQKSE